VLILRTNLIFLIKFIALKNYLFYYHPYLILDPTTTTTTQAPDSADEPTVEGSDNNTRTMKGE